MTVNEKIYHSFRHLAHNLCIVNSQRYFFSPQSFKNCLLLKTKFSSELVELHKSEFRVWRQSLLCLHSEYKQIKLEHDIRQTRVVDPVPIGSEFVFVGSRFGIYLNQEPDHRVRIQTPINFVDNQLV